MMSGYGNLGLGGGLPHLGQSGFLVLLVWSIFWKGVALWHSARRGENIWFMAILIVNTVGILEIIYLFLFAKIKPSKLFKSK